MMHQELHPRPWGLASETQLALRQGTGPKSSVPTPRAVPGYQGHVQGLRDHDPGRRFGSSSSHLFAARAAQQEATRKKKQQEKEHKHTAANASRFLKFSKPSGPSLPMLETSKATHNPEALASLPSEQLQEITLAEREESREYAYRGHMVPGYSGHVPRLRDQLAVPFGTASAEAVSRFDKGRVRSKARTHLSRSAPSLQPTQPDRRDTASAETLAFEANKNYSAFNAPYTERTPYSRKAGAMPGTTKHVPYKEHTSIGRSFPSAVRESAQLMRASRPESSYSSADNNLTRIARAKQQHPSPRPNRPLYTKVEKRDFVVSPRFGFK